MWFFGGRASTADVAMKRADEERALLRGVVMRVMPEEFRAGGRLASAPSVRSEPSVLIPPIPIPRAQKDVVPPRALTEKQSSIVTIRSYIIAKRLLFVWIGIAVLASGVVGGVLLVWTSVTPSTSAPVIQSEQIASAPLPVVEEVIEPSAGEVIATDTDGDGVTDPEEVVYASDPTRADTDGDGYSDQLELLNLYNPAGLAPVRLVESGTVIAYTHPRDGYTVFIPRGWVTTEVEESGQRVVRHSAPEGGSIELALYENPQRLSAETWYRLEHREESQEVFTSLSHEDVEGVWSSDHRFAIVSRSRAVGGPERMVVIRYDESGAPSGQFATTMAMLVRSIAWTR